jgi:hypothetical protein
VPAPTLNVGFNKGPNTLIASAGKLAYASPAAIFTKGATSGASLLTYISTLGPAGGGYLSGATLNWYQGTPLNVLNAATATFAGIQATGVVANQVTAFGPPITTTTGSNTNLLPCIIDISTSQSGGGNPINDVGGTQPNIATTNTAPNDWLSLAQYFNANGFIVKIDWQPVSPLLNANPWATIFTPGSTANTTLNSWIDALSTHCKTLANPFLLCFGIEENISGSSYTNSNFYRIGLATSAQSAQLWQYFVTRVIANGVNNCLFCFEPNSGVGNYLHGYPGDAYVDLMCFDYGDLNYNDTNMYAALTTSQSGTNGLATGITSSGAKPIFAGSLIANINDSSLQTPNAYSNYQAYLNCVSFYPRIFGAVTWAQTCALNGQNQAALAMSGSGWKDHTKLPVFPSAGGIGQGAVPPGPAAAVGFNVKTFDSTTLGTTAGTLQSFNFYGNTVPAGGITQSGSTLILSGNSGNSYGATVCTAAYNASKPQLIQGMAFGGGFYREVTLSFTGTQSGDAVAIWEVDAEHASGFKPIVNGSSWIEVDGPEWDISGSTTQYGISLHNWTNQGSGNVAINEPHIVAASPVTIPSGSFANQNVYGLLWVTATASTQGYLRFYFNGSPIGTQVTNAQGISCSGYWNQYSSGQAFPPAGSNIGNVIDTLHLMTIIGSSSTATPATVISARVWQATSANNIVV